MVSLKKLVTSDVGVAVVCCSDWPDVCDKYNITTYPTVFLFRYLYMSLCSHDLAHTHIHTHTHAHTHYNYDWLISRGEIFMDGIVETKDYNYLNIFVGKLPST